MSPFARRGPPGPAPPLTRPSGLTRREEEEEKEAEDALAASIASNGGGWKGGPLAPAGSPDRSSLASSHLRSHSSVLGPLQSARGTGFEISAEFDNLRNELQELRSSNGALQQTNQELHEALSQVTERSKMLSTEHARFLDEFRDKSQKSKQKLINDRASLKLNLSSTNTRIEDLEQLNSTVESEKAKATRKLEELTYEHDTLAVNYANLQREKQIWIKKEEEFLEIQTIQTRNLEELNQTVLQIQEEREGWHQRYQETQEELQRAQQHAHSLEMTVQAQDHNVQALNTSLLTSQEEVMNLTQTLATHLEQIANITKQNQELHATLVNFTRTNDREYVAGMLPDVSGLDMSLNQRIEIVHHGDHADPNLSPAFHGPIPQNVHSSAFLSPSARAAHSSAGAAFNFLHTTSSLSTLHLPATYLTAKLSSYILWILEHKQILENMLQRKEKLRKELEEQIVVANVEAQVMDSTGLAMSEGPGSPIRGGRSSPTGSPLRRSASPFSPTRSTSVPMPSSALPPPTLLLPSLLQHTLHDLHELTHLTQHDELQFSNFEREKSQILTQCSSHGYQKHNTKRTKTAWNIWVAALNQRILRRQTLHRILQRNYLRQIARSFARLHSHVLVRFGLSKIQEKSNEMKAKIVVALIKKANEIGDYNQQLVFLQWRTNARRRAKLRQKFVGSFVNAADTRILELWTKWKVNVLKLRHRATVSASSVASTTATQHVRKERLDKMAKLVKRQLHKVDSTTQRTLYLAWRAAATQRRARKHQVLRRLTYICCGQGKLLKVWNQWKVFHRRHQLSTVSSDLVTTRANNVERFDRQRENFLVGYNLLRERYKNFKLYHWWRLAYVDTQWLKREDQWRRALIGQKQIQLHSLVQLHRHASVVPAFQAWRKAAHDGRVSKRRGLHRIFRRLVLIQKRYVFRDWVRASGQTHVEGLEQRVTLGLQALATRKQKFIMSLVQKWRRHHLGVAFNQLYDQVKARKSRKREILDRTVRRLQQTQTWGAFRTWQSFCEKQAVSDLKSKLVVQKNKFSAVLVQRCRLGALVPAFAEWRNRVAEKKVYRRSVIERTFNRMIHSSLWRAMRLWRRHTEQSNVGALQLQLAQQLTAQKRWRAAEMIKRWRLAALVPAFTQWQNFRMLRKKKRLVVLDRTCRRIQNAAVWKAFRMWVGYSEKCAVGDMQVRLGVTYAQAASQRNKMAEHMLTKWRVNREKVRFLAWRTYTAHTRAHKRSVLDRTFKRLCSRYLNNIWSRWQKFVEVDRMADMHTLVKQTKTRTAQQAILKWRHRIVTTPFLNWRNHTRRRKVQKKHVLDRMARFLTHHQVSGAFQVWTTFLEQTKLAFMKKKFAAANSDLSEQVAEHKRKRIVTMIQRWRGASLSTRFQQWRIYARTNRAKKKVRLDQILKRMLSSQLWKGWRQWLNYRDMHRLNAAQVASDGALVEFKRQTSVNAQEARTKHILTKTLNRMSNLLLFSGWIGWVEFTQASRAYDITKQKLKLEAQTQLLQKQQAELIRTHTQHNLERQQQLVDKTLRRLAYANLYRALRVWKKAAENYAVDEMRQKMKSKENHLKMRLITTKIAQHRRNALLPIMQRWRKYTKATKERKLAIMDKFVMRFAYLKVWQALKHWKAAAQCIAVEDLRREFQGKLDYQKRQRAQQLIQTWRHRSLEPTFASWRAYTQKKHQRQHLLNKVFNRLSQLRAYNAFREWKVWSQVQATREQRLTRKRVVIDRTVKRMCSTMLYRALRTWVSFADQHKQAQLSLSLKLLRSSAVTAKLSALARGQIKTTFIEWRRCARSSRQNVAQSTREQDMVAEMSQYRKLDVLDRTYRRVVATSMFKALHHWRTYVLRARLIVNDKLGEYSELILALRKQSEVDSLKLHESITENQKLKSSILSIKHKQQTMGLLSEKQRENRAILFAYNNILAKAFRAFYQRIHHLRRRKLILHKACQHVKENVLLRGLHQWKRQIMMHRSQMMQHALDTAKRQLDQCLGKVWSLESQLSQRSAEAEAVATESEQLLLNAQAQEMNHQLEKQMPNEREIALAQEVDTLAAKMELLLKEVKQRGSHISFLSAENQRLSVLVKGGPISVGFPSPTASAAGSAIHNHTLNLSSSFARSARAASAAAASAPNDSLSTSTTTPAVNRYLPSGSPSATVLAGAGSSLNATNPRSTSFFPTNVSNVSFQ